MADLKLEFLDVGQGDGTLIQFPNGELMLVDLGSLKNRKITLKDINKYVFDNFPRLRLFGHLDYLVITHGDADHYNLIKSLLEYNSVISLGTLLYSGNKSDYKTFGTYLGKLEGRASNHIVLPDAYRSDPGTPYWSIGGVDVWILSANYPSRGGSATNPKSIVLRLKLGDVTIILGADATKSTENGILKAYSKNATFLECNLLKIPHHGSDTSSGEDWIEATIGPKNNDRSIDVAVSADMRDGYGLPKCPIMKRYLDFGTLHKYPDDFGWVCWDTSSDVWDDRKQKEGILATLETADQGVQWEYRTDGVDIFIGRT